MLDLIEKFVRHSYFAFSSDTFFNIVRNLSVSNYLTSGNTNCIICICSNPQITPFLGRKHEDNIALDCKTVICLSSGRVISNLASFVNCSYTTGSAVIFNKYKTHTLPLLLKVRLKPDYRTFVDNFANWGYHKPVCLMFLVYMLISYRWYKCWSRQITHNLFKLIESWE